MSIFDDVIASIMTMYWFSSDLKDIPFTEEQKLESAYYDNMATAQAGQHRVSGGHVYDANGRDLGPSGKVVV